MFLEIFGFVLSACLAGIFLLLKLTGDLYPTPLKKYLYQLALKNWRNGIKQTLDFYHVNQPKSTADTGILPCAQELELELPRIIRKRDEGDDLLFYGVDDTGNALVLRSTRFYGGLAEANILLQLNGSSFKGSCTGRAGANEFAVGNVKLELVEPMRSWRVWFNGQLTTTNAQNEPLFVHAVINLLWKPLYGPFDLQKDVNIHLLSEHLAQAGKFGEGLFDFKPAIPQGYRQFGVLYGTISIDGIGTEKPFSLYGNRLRRSLTVPEVNDNHDSPSSDVEVFAMCASNGNAFNLTASNGMWVDGTSCHVSGQNYSMNVIDALATDFNDDRTLPRLFSFQANKHNHRVEVWPVLEKDLHDPLEVIPLTVTINGDQSKGLLMRNLNQFSTAVTERLEQNLTESVRGKSWDRSLADDFVDLNSSKCSSVSLVGGKGASLASLCKKVSSKDLQNQFKTSPGFCVTTYFFRRMLDLEKFEEIFKNTQGQESELEEACTAVRNLIMTTGVEDKIRHLVSVWVHKKFVECSEEKEVHLNATRFAVRSSGTLEDGADLSCAGQNETFLGVKEENIPQKIVECWASLFTSQSVLYRLNHGQPAVSDMGVVVQAMVNASAAGVVFSADPISGNPFETFITANYGLGESVVSASCDPDTIQVVRSRDGSNSLRIGSIGVGEKKTKVVYDQNGGGGGSTEVPTTSEESRKCCISEENALKLVNITVKLVAENDGKPLDIEWAIDGGEIYILQSRNITSLDAWSDFEIIHELDTPLRTQFEILTTANVGEVMPGAVSPLSFSVLTKALDVAIQGKLEKQYNTKALPTCLRTMSNHRRRLFINILQIMYRHNEKTIAPAMACIDLAIYGHVVIDEKIHRLAVERWGVDSPRTKIGNFVNMVKSIIQTRNAMKDTAAKFDNYKLNFQDSGNNSKALYDYITPKLVELQDIVGTHCFTSEASTSSQVLSFVILSEGRNMGEWDTTLYNDVSKISSVCGDVESADIPVAMDTLAKKIVAEGDEVVRSVIEASDEEALAYITNSEALREAYDEFMNKHGHRGIFELDLMRQSWKTEPLSFIGLVKSLVGSKWKLQSTSQATVKIQYPNDEALVNDLQSVKKNSTRKILKFVLPYARSAVWNREKTKSLLIRVANEFKLAYNALGEQMTREKLISHPKLVYFFTHYELGQIIGGSPFSPRILYKVMRRDKLHQQLDKEEYSEFVTGDPQPIDQSIPIELGDQIKATPVSSGKIQGIAKVCHSVEDASRLIKPGDILITHGTDIGWSPFFPILGGVVTELGGLISHGAVVAREYGLPCIVGATHATKIFQTGEEVLLNATEGTLSKVRGQNEK